MPARPWHRRSITIRCGLPPAQTSAGSAASAGGRRAGFTAVAVTLAATGVDLGSVLTRALAARRVPWGNLYEFILTATLAAALAWLVLLARRPVRPVGLFVTLSLAVLLGGAGRVHVRVAPLVPALDSPWLRIHVAAAATAAGLLLLGFVAAALYLLRLRHDGATAAGHPVGPTIGALPAAATLDRLALRLHALAFPVWTFAVVCGAVWAEAAWGRYWAWDPRKYGRSSVGCCTRPTCTPARPPGWRGRPAALIAVAGWTTMMVNLFAVNMLVPSLHSYAGI